MAHNKSTKQKRAMRVRNWVRKLRTDPGPAFHNLGKAVLNGMERDDVFYRVQATIGREALRRIARVHG